MLWVARSISKCAPNMKFPSALLVLLSSALLLRCDLAVSQIASAEEPDTPSTIVMRGRDHAVFEKRVIRFDAYDNEILETNRFTLLENCLHYQEGGEWKASEDVIEITPEGAVAKRGPNKCTFSHDLNSEAVFEIQSSDGQRIRGGIRGIQLFNIKTEQTATIGTVRKQVQGHLLPPNQILYRDAFDGITGDVVLTWKHNLFSHDVIFLTAPRLPEGWDLGSTRIEIITEFFTDIAPEIRAASKPNDQPTDVDHSVIDLGALAIITGRAFPLVEGAAFDIGGFRDSGSTVQKNWYLADDGRQFLVESISLSEIAGDLERLPSTERDEQSHRAASASSGARQWPERPGSDLAPRAMQVAAFEYNPKGYLIDFVIVPDQGTPTTLLSGETYYVKTSYYSGSSVTFQPGCVVKFKNNAYMLLYGPVTFPSSGQPVAIFTSRNDNTYGQTIAGVSGEADSNGDPTLHRAAQAIWIYYVDFSTEVRNALIRWAKKGIQYDRNSWQTQNHTIRDCRFEQITGSGSAGVAGTSYLTVINLKRCNVTNPGVTMTVDCSGDTDGDGLDDAWETQYFGNLGQSGFGDPDGDDQSNAEEFIIVSNPAVDDDPFEEGNLNSGDVLSGEVYSTYTPNGSTTHRGIFFFANGNVATSMVATEPTSGNVRLQWHSIFVDPFGSATGPENYKPTEAEVRLLRDAFGPGTGTGGQGVSQPNPAKVSALPQHLLQYYEQVASAQVRKISNLLQNGAISEEIAARQIHTMTTRLNAVQQALARLGKILPVIGGIFVLSSSIQSAQAFNDAVEDYANDVRNEDDVTGSAAIVAGECNNLAPGSGNLVLDYILF